MKVNIFDCTFSETRKWVYASGGYLRSPKTGEIAPCKGKPCLISSFELSGHQFGTILKSFALTFQSASIQPSPVEYCLSRMQETQFQVAKTPGTCFFLEKKPPAGLHHTEVRTGDASTHCFDQNPDIQISKYPDVQISTYPDIQISRYHIPDHGREPNFQGPSKVQIFNRWVAVGKFRELLRYGDDGHGGLSDSILAALERRRQAVQ